MQARATWRTDEAAGLGGIAPERLVFIDESAVLTSMARRYGRSSRGERAYAKVPFGNWKRLSVLSAIGVEGFLATIVAVSLLTEPSNVRLVDKRAPPTPAAGARTRARAGRRR